MPCRRPGGFGAVNGCGSPYAAVWDVPRAPTAASSANGSTRPFADLHGHAGGWSTEREWTERAKRFVKAELKRADVTYEELAGRLREMGLEETKVSIASKLSRGGFGATFFIATMKAIGRETVNISEV
jgi:hypothetical protein